jgi:hypothetical protein
MDIAKDHLKINIASQTSQTAIKGFGINIYHVCNVAFSEVHGMSDATAISSEIKG